MCVTYVYWFDIFNVRAAHIIIPDVFYVLVSNVLLPDVFYVHVLQFYHLMLSMCATHVKYCLYLFSSSMWSMSGVKSSTSGLSVVQWSVIS